MARATTVEAGMGAGVPLVTALLTAALKACPRTRQASGLRGRANRRRLGCPCQNDSTPPAKYLPSDPPRDSCLAPWPPPILMLYNRAFISDIVRLATGQL